MALVATMALPALAGVADFAARRAAMVNALRKRDIRNARVLAAMGKVPRHLFLDKSQQGRAYEEAELPVGEAHVMCSPYAVAIMAQLLAVEPGKKVLEVGACSGYLAAVLTEMGGRVYLMEAHSDAVERARRILGQLGYRSVQCRAGSACKGWPEEGPFDAIVVTCAADRLPEPLVTQLKEGGRLVAPIGRGPEQTLNCMREHEGRLRAETVDTKGFIRMSPMVCQSPR